MFWEYFRITGSAVSQIFLIGALGYFLVKENILGEAGLNSLSRLVVKVTLPLLIFCQLIKNFRFSLYPHWWLFPLLSIVITTAGLLLGLLFTFFVRGQQQKMQVLSLIAFQNSGYLPLALIAALLTGEKADTMLTYLFLFLLGFNLLVWSLGVYMLSFHESKKFELASLFSPPVIAILFSLAIIFFGLNNYIPQPILRPLRLVGDCTLPLALLVVGGNLASIRLRHINKKAVLLTLAAKLVILPVLGLCLVIKFNLPQLLSLLIVMESAVPPATSLSIISRHYKKEDLLISQGVFFGHVASLVTLPVFLSLYFMLAVIK